MITGDKLETAENIAHSAGIFELGMKIFHIQKFNKDKIKSFIIDLNQEMMKVDSKWKKGIVMDMRFMNFVFEKINRASNPLEIPPEYRMLQQLMMTVESVVWARSTPKQKASIVKFVKDQGKITLSIGDGANDVNMLGVANIGVGLYGEEGLQAVQASDFAIANFKYLQVLIFVYGRANYIRIVRFVFMFIYKNILFTLPQIIYGFYCFFAATTIYEGQYVSLFNLFFTWCPINYLAVADYDIKYYYVMSDKEAKLEAQRLENEKETNEMLNKKEDKSFEDTADPIENGENDFINLKILKNLKDNFHYLYYITQKNHLFNWQKFWMEMSNWVIQSVWITLITMFGLNSEMIISEGGQTADFWIVSFALYASIIITVHVTLLIRSGQIDVIMVLFLVLTIFAPYYLFLMVVYDNMADFNAQSSFSYSLILKSSQFYFVIGANVFVWFIVEYITSFCKYNFWPNLADYFRHLIKEKLIDNPSYFTENQMNSFRILNDPTKKHKTITTTLTSKREIIDVVSFNHKGNIKIFDKIKNFFNPSKNKNKSKKNGGSQPGEYDQTVNHIRQGMIELPQQSRDFENDFGKIQNNNLMNSSRVNEGE